MIFTIEQKLKSLRREIALRKKAYPRWIGSGKMTQAVADHEIAVMESIHHDIEVAPQIEVMVDEVIKNLSNSINTLLDLFPDSDRVRELKRQTAQVIASVNERLGA